MDVKMFNQWHEKEMERLRYYKDKFTSLPKKKQRVLLLLPNVIIFMILMIYLSGITRYQSDYILAIGIVVVIGFILFFAPTRRTF